jgi:hypothetical protein
MNQEHSTSNKQQALIDNNKHKISEKWGRMGIIKKYELYNQNMSSLKCQQEINNQINQY